MPLFADEQLRWMFEKGIASTLALVTLCMLLLKSVRVMLGRYLIRPLFLFVLKKYPGDVVQALLTVIRNPEHRTELEKAFGLPEIRHTLGSLEDTQQEQFALIDRITKRVTEFADDFKAHVAKIEPVVTATNTSMHALRETYEERHVDMSRSMTNMRAEMGEVRGSLSSLERTTSALLHTTIQAKQ